MARIGIIIYSLSGGGAERMSLNLASEFLAAGHAVDFVLANDEGELMDQVPAMSGVYVAPSGGAKSWRAVIRNYTAEKAPDVLLAMMEGASVISIQAMKKSKAPVPVVARIPNHFSTHCRESPRWKERYLMPLAARWHLPAAKLVVAISNGVREDIISTLGLKRNKVVTIYNPALVTRTISSSKAHLHSWFDQERKWNVIVTAGRLTAQKQQDVLLKSIALSNMTSDTRLILLGKGELEIELRALSRSLGIEDKVDFVGFVDDPSSYFLQADIFALSSAWEGFGNVLVEALAAGAAVVSTDCPSGPSEILDKGRFGQLVPVGDSEALANAILRAKAYSVNLETLTEHLKQFEGRAVATNYLRVMGLTEL